MHVIQSCLAENSDGVPIMAWVQRHTNRLMVRHSCSMFGRGRVHAPFFDDAAIVAAGVFEDRLECANLLSTIRSGGVGFEKPVDYQGINQ